MRIDFSTKVKKIRCFDASFSCLMSKMILDDTLNVRFEKEDLFQLKSEDNATFSTLADLVEFISRILNMNIQHILTRGNRNTEGISILNY